MDEVACMLYPWADAPGPEPVARMAWPEAVYVGLVVCGDVLGADWPGG